MTNITLYSDRQAETTVVPNRFIDEYMTQANGEFVKIYLYLLRNLRPERPGVSLSDLADHFSCTERDVLRALRYWERLHLFRLEFDENENLSGICVLSEAAADTPASKKAEQKRTAAARKPAGDENVTARFIQAASATVPRAYSMDDMRAFCEKEDVRNLIFSTEQQLGRTLNQTDLNMIFFWYDDLAFSAELIRFLIESCAAKGHTNLHYIHRIAQDFASRSIRTVPEAQDMMEQDTAVYHAVMKAFGIRGRNLVPEEREHLRKWNLEMGFSAEMIGEACSRTIRAIHEPSFEYANSILENWKNGGIRTLDDAAKADETRRQQNAAKKNANENAATASSSNRFLNFRQRDNNYEDLQKQLLQKSLLNQPE